MKGGGDGAGGGGGAKSYDGEKTWFFINRSIVYGQPKPTRRIFHRLTGNRLCGIWFQMALTLFLLLVIQKKPKIYCNPGFFRGLGRKQFFLILYICEKEDKPWNN
jgi:hypothetical protein